MSGPDRLTLAQQLGRVRRRRRHGRRARRRRAPASSSASSTSSGSASPRTGCRPAPPRSATSPTRAATRRRPRSASRAGPGAPRRRSPTACSRTPSTTTTPTCRRCCTRAPAWSRPRSPRPSTPARPAPSVVRAVAVGLEVAVRLGMAGYDERARQLGLLRARPARHVDQRRDGRRGGGRARCSALDGTASSTRSASPRRWRPASSRPTAPAAPSSGCTAAGPPRPASPPPQLVRRGFTGPPTVLEGRFGFFQAWLHGQFVPDAVTDGLGHDWSVPGIFFKPYPANHFTHAVVDAGARAARARRTPDDVASITIGVPGRGDPHDRRADRGQARAGDRLPGAVQRPVRRDRRPARRRRARSRARRLHRRARRTTPPAVPDGAGRRRARRALRRDLPAPVPGRRHADDHARRRGSSRRCSPTAAGPSGRCRDDELATKFRDNVAGRLDDDAAAAAYAPAATCPRPSSPRCDATAPARPDRPTSRPAHDPEGDPHEQARPDHHQRLGRRPGRDEPQPLDIGVTRRQDRRDRGRAIDLAEPRRWSTAAASSPSRASSTPTSTGASTTRCPRTPSARAARPRRAASPPRSPTCAPAQYYLNKGGPYARVLPRGAGADRGPRVRRLRLPPGADEQARTSTRSPSLVEESRGARRSRSSCSTAGTGCTAAPPTRARS